MGFWELDADDVVEAIKSWEPGPCFTEARFQESLFCFLENRFRRKDLGKEVQVNRSRADIMITLPPWRRDASMQSKITSTSTVALCQDILQRLAMASIRSALVMSLAPAPLEQSRRPSGGAVLDHLRPS
jgi:hypothetical protein